MMTTSEHNHWHLWREAAGRDAIDSAIRLLYDDLGAAVAERRPVCNASGRCCRFEAFGHRLYVTGLEIAWVLLGVRGLGLGVGGEGDGSADSLGGAGPGVRLRQLAPTANPPTANPQTANPPTPTPGTCPYQVDGLCSVHVIRPLGCRVFFCEQGTEGWQQDTTELFLNRLKRLHAEHGLPYAYMEWRTGLAEAKRYLP